MPDADITVDSFKSFIHALSEHYCGHYDSVDKLFNSKVQYLNDLKQEVA